MSNAKVAVKEPKAPMTKPVKPPKKRKAKSLDKAKARSGWFFFAPFVLTPADDLHKHPKQTFSETISTHPDFPKNHFKDPHRKQRCLF